MKSSLLQSSKKSSGSHKLNSHSTTTAQLLDKRKLTQDQQHLNNLANSGKTAVQLKEFGQLLNGNATLQKISFEEEEPLQGKFETIQKQGLEEEEELMQGKFNTIQKMGLEEEEPLQGKFETIQKQGMEEEELIQGKFKTIQTMSIEEEEPLQGKFESIQKQENNTGLPDNLKSGIENLSGYSMDDVKVHYNSDKPATLQAHAFAQGRDIHIASGQEKHLPHEAWHVVQQKQGRVKPTLQLQGKVNVNDDAGLEKEADVMGEQSIQMKFQNDRRKNKFTEFHKKSYRQNESPNLNLSSKIVQQVPIETAGGTWDTSKYEAWGPKKPDPISDIGIGAEISLSFMPGKSSPFGKKIGLIQSVTAMAKGKPDPTFDEAVPLNQSGRAIDRGKGESGSRTTNPVYGAHNKRGKIASNLTDNVPDKGENTFGLRNRFGANKAATLWDMPSSAVVKGEISKSFETTAVVLEGKEAGTYLGSVGWGYRRSDGEHNPKLDPPTLKLISQGNPSKEFTEAANEWNAAGKNNGEDLVKIPIPT